MLTIAVVASCTKVFRIGCKKQQQQQQTIMMMFCFHFPYPQLVQSPTE